jgi:hypothetical protein
MEAMISFEALVPTYKTTQHNNPEDHNPQFHPLDNFILLSNFIIDTILFWRFSAFTHFVTSVSSCL